MLSFLKKYDWIVIVSAVLLFCFGLASIYSSSIRKDNFLNFDKQIIFFAVAVFAMFAVSLIDWRTLRDNSYNILALYFICVILLAGLLLFGPITRGIRGWYRIGLVSLDPVEFTKVVLIILLAKFFSTRHVEMYNIKHIILSGIYVAVPTVLIFFQPNFGSALILVLLWAGILIISGIKLRHFLILVLLGILVLSASWFLLIKDYQKARIVGFLAPSIEPLGIGWNQNQAKIAIGSGGLFGQGFGNGSQTRLGFLPEPQNDFIFASISEEFGLLGISVMFILFILIVWRSIKIAINAESNFPRLFATGFVVVLICQLFVHVGMNLGILPVIGISLPFVSYGGSGLVAFFINIGILQSIKTHH
jgi:rod shape determining protein RodA